MICCQNPDQRLVVVFANLVLEGLYKELLRQDRFQQWGLTSVQFQALQYVHLHPAATPCEMAEAFSISDAAATKLVQRLERKGLLRRQAGTEDRRRWELYLTQAGERLWSTIHWAFQKRLAAILHEMGAVRRDQLMQGLEAFLVAAVDTPQMVDHACLRCGTVHDQGCLISLRHLELTGEELATV